MIKGRATSDLLGGPSRCAIRRNGWSCRSSASRSHFFDNLTLIARRSLLMEHLDAALETRPADAPLAGLFITSMSNHFKPNQRFTRP